MMGMNTTLAMNPCQDAANKTSTCEAIVIRILRIGQARQYGPLFLKTAAGRQGLQWHNLAVLD